MKLLYCPVCGDVARLINTRWRTCECGRAGGQYNADLMTATIGGVARVFGVGNPFFNEMWPLLNDEGKQKIREKWGYGGQTDAWWGEYPGDLQIFRIQSSMGPRLRVIFRRAADNTLKGKALSLERAYANEVRITDRRPYTIDGKTGVKSVIVPANPVPSFRLIKRKKS